MKNRLSGPGVTLGHYVEGRASGFPFWPTVVLSARWTLLYKILRRHAVC